MQVIGWKREQRYPAKKRLGRGTAAASRPSPWGFSFTQTHTRTHTIAAPLQLTRQCYILETPRICSAIAVRLTRPWILSPAPHHAVGMKYLSKRRAGLLRRLRAGTRSGFPVRRPPAPHTNDIHIILLGTHHPCEQFGSLFCLVGLLTWPFFFNLLLFSISMET